jgi:hypothetical protein
MRVEDYLAQMPMFERELTDFQEKVMIALHDRRRSSKRIGDLLTTYANLVIDSPHPEQKALIEIEKPTKEMLWDEAMRQTEKETEPAPALFQNWCLPNNKEGEEKMKTELKADPLLAEIASQLCSGRVCFARSDKTDRLPICSPSEAKALERCITKVKAKQPKYCEKEWHKPPEEMRKGCYNPWAVCRASVGCRLGGMPKYEKRIKS